MLRSLISAWFLAAIPAIASTGDPVSVSLALGGLGHEMVYDASRDRVYVSVPAANKVVAVSTVTWQIVTTYPVTHPLGVALSPDGTRLYVAKYGSGSVAVIDPIIGFQTEIPLAAQLGDVRTWDVIEATPGRLYVSASPGSNNYAWIVQVKLDQGNSAQRVASNTIIRDQPIFEVSADGTALYIGEPQQSIYRLDLTQPDAPLAVQTHVNLIGVNHLEVDPGNTRLYLREGQVVDAATLQVIGLLSDGVPRFRDDPTRIFYSTSALNPTSIETWSAVTQQKLATLPLPCGISLIRDLLILPGDSGFVILGDNKLCGLVQIPPCVSGVEPYCPPAPNSSGPGAMLDPVGAPFIAANEFGLLLTGAPPASLAIFFYGGAPAHLPFGDGWLCTSPAPPGIYRVPGIYMTDPGGTAAMQLDFGNPPLSAGPIMIGSTWYFQAWFRDPGGIPGTGMNTSGGLKVGFCP